MNSPAPDIDLARQRLKALKNGTYLPGSYQKRFVRDTSVDGDLSERQVAYIEILAWRYRRQIPARLVPAGKPPDLPPKQKPPRTVTKPSALGKTEQQTLFPED